MPLIINVVGARPNFVKMAPVVREMTRRGLKQKLVHTGQHYDAHMSDIFFTDLNFPLPDVNLGVGSGTHASQTAEIMKRFEKVCVDEKPALVVVAGDVNSTVACALTAAKLGIPVAHVESGLRSFDRTMPEEINRVVTDHLAQLLFVTEPSGRENLIKEGVEESVIRETGNSMIDSLFQFKEKALERQVWQRYGFQESRYALLTLHRPENVDNPVTLFELSQAISRIGEKIPVLFPAHPRTLQRMGVLGAEWANLTLIESLGYLDFLSVTARAAFVLTDSGGLQEETAVLGVPCLTLRKNTERPITVSAGTNRIVGTDTARILSEVEKIMTSPRPKEISIPLWDGHAAERIVDAIENFLNKKESCE